MKECTNLLPCPKCSGMPELLVAEMNTFLSLVCSRCGNEYNSVVNRGELFSPITEQMYKQVCYNWQEGVCRDKQIPLVMPIY
ncbi:hypothetical protein [Metalysinibacillus jejuensis]|uniref:hypothetical protein n=1 Tax=Metalysinibacillus jejuensis TaxID=914327 RepID=UPI000D361D43|nr:hypothetical protein [Metalysinibacillus jejuensis]